MRSGGNQSSFVEGCNAGEALRRKILGKVTSILAESDSIEDSSRRLLIQANCLDLVTSLEDIIQSYGLDACSLSR
ncbi:MAG: hypothetical protein GX589_06920 [Deltaproteobacteria bacterium]|nr:hypothetical protein [Deltaproteobacteria bacterium]